MKTLNTLMGGALMVAVGLIGCQDTSKAPAKAGATKAAPADHTGHTASSGPQKLGDLMAGLGKDMAEIHAALWREDFGAVATAAAAIANHPKVTAEDRTRISGILGKEMPAFAAGDHRVHSAAQRLSDAAKAKDEATTLKELAELQAGCVSCHSSFRKRLIVKPKP